MLRLLLTMTVRHIMARALDEALYTPPLPPQPVGKKTISPRTKMEHTSASGREGGIVQNLVSLVIIVVVLVIAHGDARGL
jgi:hypothetical protein